MTNDQAKNHTSPAPEFTIQRVYAKDLSLECPQSPQIFKEEWRPELNLQFGMSTNSFDKSVYELTLQITVTATSKEKTLFLVEIKQAGLFTLKGFTEEQTQQVLNITCPTILFPYAREAVSDLVGKAGFPPLYLAPVNFEALYMQQMEEQNAASTKANSESSIITD